MSESVRAMAQTVAKYRAKVAPHVLSEALPERSLITREGGKLARTLAGVVDLGVDLLYSDEFIGPMKTAMKNKPECCGKNHCAHFEECVDDPDDPEFANEAEKIKSSEIQ